jgi:diadenosine tetraphosphatase ApaH/serine/threonine PP2A family protein phosphatase
MTARPLRFTKSHPCPICGGHDGLARGLGVRCFGYRSGDYARCTREEHAGRLPQNRDGTYSHKLDGTCRCGQAHGEAQAGNGCSAARPLRRRAEQRFRSFHTLRAFLLGRYGEGTEIRHWIYHDAAGDEVFRVLRIDYTASGGSAAKSYRPCHRAADGRWLLSRPDRLLPLYRLPSILPAPPETVITVLEGEKCADIAAALGLPFATASAHGAKAHWLTDWSPLAGRSVAILRDQDEDGEGYAARVAALLAALDPAARVHTVALPGLSDSEDIEQFIEIRRTAGRADADILAELRALIAPSG